MSERPAFVAREGELEQLDSCLDRAFAGQGLVCFVVGEAGSGKTALLSEFTQRAQERCYPGSRAGRPVPRPGGSLPGFCPRRGDLGLSGNRAYRGNG